MSSDTARSRPLVALFGGSFNPPHHMHRELARRLLGLGRFSELWVLPTNQHPLGKQLAPFEQRLEMCRLTFSGLDPRLRVSDFERKLGGMSYTVRTVEALQRAHPGVDFALIVGSDVLAERSQWREHERLERLVEFVVVPRTGHPCDDPRCLEMAPLPDISSTGIRQRAAAGEPLDGLVEPSVAAYIREHGLYGETTRSGGPAAAGTELQKGGPEHEPEG